MLLQVLESMDSARARRYHAVCAHALEGLAELTELARYEGRGRLPPLLPYAMLCTTPPQRMTAIGSVACLRDPGFLVPRAMEPIAALL